MDKDVIMNDETEDKLAVRLMVFEKALKEIVSISEMSTGQAAAFYGMLARKALERGKD